MPGVKRVRRKASSSSRVSLDDLPHEMKVHVLQMCDTPEALALFARTCRTLAAIARDLLPQKLAEWTQVEWNREKESTGYTFFRHSGVVARKKWMSHGTCGFYCGVRDHADARPGIEFTRYMIPEHWLTSGPPVWRIRACSGETPHVLGEKQGLGRYWNHRGQLVATCDYVDGKRHGEMRGYRQPLTVLPKEPLCRPVSRGATSAPDLSALVQEPADPLWWRVEYKKGTIDGVIETFNRNGTLALRMHVKNGERCGAHDEYDEEGRIGFHAEWQEGDVCSLRLSYGYTEDGRLDWKMYDWGQGETCEQYFDDDGNLQREYKYHPSSESLYRAYRPDGTLREAIVKRLNEDGTCAEKHITLYREDGVTPE